MHLCRHKTLERASNKPKPNPAACRRIHDRRSHGCYCVRYYYCYYMAKWICNKCIAKCLCVGEVDGARNSKREIVRAQPGSWCGSSLGDADADEERTTNTSQAFVGRGDGIRRCGMEDGLGAICRSRSYVTEFYVFWLCTVGESTEYDVN